MLRAPEITALARDQRSRSVTLRLRPGGLSQRALQPRREHFERAASGPCLDGVQLDMESRTELSDSRPQEVLLEAAELEA